MTKQKFDRDSSRKKLSEIKTRGLSFTTIMALNSISYVFLETFII